MGGPYNGDGIYSGERSCVGGGAEGTRIGKSGEKTRKERWGPEERIRTRCDATKVRIMKCH